jgi:hypothetical protein
VVTAQAALAAAATLVAVAFTFCTLDRWLSRRRRHDLAWTVALAMFAIASSALWLGSSVGFTGPTFRVFFLFGAILNVPYLALGTVYLFAGQRTGDRVALGLTCAAFFAAGVMVVAPLKAPTPGTDLPTGSEVFGPLPRILAAVGSAGARSWCSAERSCRSGGWWADANARGRGLAGTRSGLPWATPDRGGNAHPRRAGC